MGHNKPTEENNIRAKSRDYARLFLANKYKNEYRELANAYCRNRGVSPLRGKSDIDERTGQVSEELSTLLTEEEKKRRANVRANSTTYAKTFLVNKYKEEYFELAEAYCRNRGTTLHAVRKIDFLVDERELVS